MPRFSETEEDFISAADGGETDIGDNYNMDDISKDALQKALQKVKMHLKNLGKGSSDPGWDRARKEYEQIQSVINSALKNKH